MIADIVRERGPLTVAAFMDLALYDPELGYYARAARRSGRAGDFFTSVDVGPLFGELLEIQIAEMASLLSCSSRFDLVEAGAGIGRLSADILGAMRHRHPDLYGRVQVTLVEASPHARQAQADTLTEALDRPFTSSSSLPEAFEGVLFANELLDAFPVHQVVMRENGLREVYVTADPGAGHSGSLSTIEGPPSTPALAAYLDRLGVTLEHGWRVEINLRAVEWIREASRRLRRGFIVVADYGHEARGLYSVTHSTGTLTTFSRHMMRGPESRAEPPVWLENPGGQDITAHVDFTSVRLAAESEGLHTLGFMDQTYFVMALLPELGNLEPPGDVTTTARRTRPVNLQLKTLLMPGGLGSTIKIMMFGKGVGTPALRGCSYRMRVT